MRAMIGAALMLGVSSYATAQSQGATPGAWQFEFTPYLWAAGMKGDVKAGTLPTTGVDMKFTDIAKILDFGLMGAFEARKDRWGFLFDGMYMKVSDSATARQTGPGPIGATLTANANLKQKQTMLAGAVAYRALEGVTPVDIIGGLRYTKLDITADVNASLFGPLGVGVAATVSRSGSKSWTDPYVGVRIQHPIADRWTLVGYADVGGASSHSSWQFAAGANYAYSKDVSIKFGYRELHIDYDKGGALFDVKMYGPYIGAGIRF